MEIIRCGLWLGEGDGYSDGEIVYDVWECSECGYTVEDDDPDLLPNYCPNCGAKMKANAPVPPNPPLTLKELREMDGEPVYFDCDCGSGHGEWAIVLVRIKSESEAFFEA